MAEFGNILIVYGKPDDQSTIDQIEGLIKPLTRKILRIENSFFIQVENAGNAREISNQIRNLGLKFIMYFNFLPDSSFLKRGAIEDGLFSEIEHIMLD